MIRNAISIKTENEALATPCKTARKGLDAATINSVTSFYKNNEFFRQLCGVKDYVSVAYKVHHQKRLPLCNLKELFCKYKKNISPRED